MSWREEMGRNFLKGKTKKEKEYKKMSEPLIPVITLMIMMMKNRYSYFIMAIVKSWLSVVQTS